MRLYFCLLCYVLIIFGNFFCSNSPFDSTTDLGSNIFNDQDSLLTIFDGEICEAVLTIDPVDSTISFIDTTGEKQSGINALTPLAIGTWDNLSSIAYFKFDAESLNTLINNGNEFHSLSFDFKQDSTESNTNASVEIGFCKNKSNNEKITRDSLWEIAHHQLANASNGTHSTVINEGYIVSSDTSTVWKTTSYKSIQSFIRTIETKKVLDSIFDCNKTIDSLYPLGKDTVVIKYNDTAIISIQMIISPSDTTYDTITTYDTLSYDLGYIVYRDTTINDSTYAKEAFVYDSITSLASLVKDGQNILYSFTLPPDSLFDTILTIDTIINISDTLYDTLVKTIVHLRDSVVTTLDTTVDYTINTKVTQIIQNSDTIPFIQYDTVYSLITIVQDTILQASTISSQITYTNHFSTEIFEHYITLENGKIDTVLDTITNLSFYTQLDSAGDNSLQFINDVHLTYTSLKKNDSDNTIIDDTIINVLYPSHFDYSVFESNTTPHDSTYFATGAAGRYVRMTLNMKPLRDKILDSTGNVVYKNIPKAVLTIFPDSDLLKSHNSAGTSVNTQYILSTEKTTDIDNVLYDSGSELFELSSQISTETDSLDIQLNTFLIEILHTQKTIPEKCYLYLGFSSSEFVHLNWKKPITGFPITFIVSNSQ